MYIREERNSQGTQGDGKGQSADQTLYSLWLQMNRFITTANREFVCMTEKRGTETWRQSERELVMLLMHQYHNDHGHHLIGATAVAMMASFQCVLYIATREPMSLIIACVCACEYEREGMFWSAPNTARL